MFLFSSLRAAVRSIKLQQEENMDDPLKRLKTVLAVVLVGLVSLVIVKADIETELSVTKNTREGIHAAVAAKAEAAQRK